jgi:UDP-N-acetylmuramoylalanine--D-glutamate ligase
LSLDLGAGDFTGKRATIMGLGLHGGGAASARFLAARGARVTVTDLKSRKELEPSLRELEPLSVRTVLGRHEKRDFLETDLVVKNPAVPDSSPFLALSRSRGIPVETDISLFLRYSDNPILAVTGSKGKSTTVSAIHRVLSARNPRCRIGGNITVSPLSFLDDLAPKAPVILELSSWQLGDLRGKGLLKPAVSLVTILLADHMDRYPGMEQYIADKKVIFSDQTEEDKAIFNYDDPLQSGFAEECRAEVLYFSAAPLPDGLRGAWLDGDSGWCRISGPESRILAEPLRVLGRHNRMNLLAAGLALRLSGLTQREIVKGLAEFGGVEHRLEFFAQGRGLRFYNDSAATVPDATACALHSLPRPIHLIAGGTDKNTDFSPLAEPLRIPARISLLQGSGTDKLIRLLNSLAIPFGGPFENLQEATEHALKNAAPGSSILFSPSCTSFGMFQNEFHRGRAFKSLILSRYADFPGSG